MVALAGCRPGPELATEPPSLQGGVNSEPRQVPVRVGRMGRVHWPGRQQVVMLSAATVWVSEW